MSAPWLNEDYPELFPPITSALEDPNGLLAVGGDLGVTRLLAAYSQGIFPWYEEFLEDGSPSPILWWCPKPRCVLALDELKISRSLHKSLRNRGYLVSFNNDFSSTIRACANSRTRPEPQENTNNTFEFLIEQEGSSEDDTSQGTWITADMISAYEHLNELGHAHSVECWLGDQLVGGLYGVSIGKMFFGESMFSKASDASKVALCYLAKVLKSQGVSSIDCQVSNPHLLSLGAKEVELSQFSTIIEEHTKQAPLVFPSEKVKPKI